MNKDRTIQSKKKQKIDAIEPSDEGLTSRAGLALFAQYLQGIGLLPILERMFGSMRKNKKGIAVSDFFLQILCFFMDGSSPRLSWFDHLKRDKSYAALLSCREEDLGSSHAVKRFFGKFLVRGYLFRHLLRMLFIWRLKKSSPGVIELGLDSMVLENDDAPKRQGVQPTYKKVKGFHPLQMNWGRYMVDAVFRGGSKHSNHGKTVEKMLVQIVNKIRREYRDDVPILVRMDAAFFDEKLFEICERLNIGYCCGGKSYANVKHAAEKATDWRTFTASSKREIWQYTEFMSRQGTWKKARRTIYSRLIEHNSQLSLPGLAHDGLIITNLGMGGAIDNQLRQAAEEQRIHAHRILAFYHGRGKDELANRALKNFAHEQLPFKKFDANAAWYYLMLVGNNLFEAFKEDVSQPVIAVSVYADTFRRQFLDIAGKLLRHAGKLILKVPKTTFERLQLDRLFTTCRQSLVPI